MAGKNYDVIVCGLGAMGSAAAASLAAKRKRVFGFDRFRPPHPFGSTHGQTRIIRKAYFEDPAYVPLVLRAYELWRKLERDSGRDLLRITGGLIVGQPDDPIIIGGVESARRFDIPYELLDAAQIRKRFPVFTPEEDYAGLYEGEAGILNPESAVSAFLREAEKNGADLGYEESLKEWGMDSATGRVQVRTDRGDYRAERLVLTTGPWSAGLFPELQLPLKVERYVMNWYQPRDHPESFHPDRFPINFWSLKDGNVFYCIPSLSSGPGGVKVAFHVDGLPCEPDTVDRRVRDTEVSALRDCLRRCLPSLAGVCLDSRVCMYTRSPDDHFILGEHPEFPSLILGVGFSGHGFKFSSVLGEILATLACGEKPALDIKPFSLRRFQ